MSKYNVQVMYRDQTYDLPGDAEGSGWSKVDGMMVWLRSGDKIVWGVSANGEPTQFPSKLPILFHLHPCQCIIP